ncbi:MAG: hypothetical protein ACREC6_08025 [Hyphomicrobiaceae bacterium]
MVLACADVAYEGDRGLAACLLFAHWQAREPLRIVRASVCPVAAYESGAFYKRELPCLLAVLARVDIPVDCLVIDGYVWLGDGSEPGLGARLFEALGGRTAIIGVAKTIRIDDRCSIPVRRGTSERPLYVTSAGIPQTEAAGTIAAMAGESRIPTLLQLADRACRF